MGTSDSVRSEFSYTLHRIDNTNFYRNLFRGNRDCLIISVGFFETGIRSNYDIDARKLNHTFSNLGFVCRSKKGRVLIEDAKREISELLENQAGMESLKE